MAQTKLSSGRALQLRGREVRCTRRDPYPSQGFTLVELVVVIMIISILATVAAPKFFGVTQTANEEALRSQLRIVRDAIDRYASQHGGDLPGSKSDGTNPAGSAQAFENQLLMYSNEEGVVSATKNPSYPLGPYLRKKPIAPLGPGAGDDRTDVVGGGVPLSATPGGEWKFDYVSGQFIFNLGDVSSDGVTRYDEF